MPCFRSVLLHETSNLDFWIRTNPFITVKLIFSPSERSVMSLYTQLCALILREKLRLTQYIFDDNISLIIFIRYF